VNRYCQIFTLGALVVVLGTLAAGPASAQSVEATASAETFGIASEVAHVVGADEFAATNSSDVWDHAAFLDATAGFITRNSNSVVTWFAPVRLPAGAVITRLELAACTAATGGVEFALLRSKVPPGSGVEELAVGNANAPSVCDRFSVTPSTPPVIENANATHWLRLTTRLGSGFESVRIFYHLQVHPSPGTATFADVPTSHPFFQFVEALVASGITVGCGGGDYCPDQAVTRGQMAVFLSKALGLHFAP
jgi:hypothetical protein